MSSCLSPLHPCLLSETYLKRHLRIVKRLIRWTRQNFHATFQARKWIFKKKRRRRRRRRGNMRKKRSGVGGGPTGILKNPNDIWRLFHFGSRTSFPIRIRKGIEFVKQKKRERMRGSAKYLIRPLTDFFFFFHYPGSAYVCTILHVSLTPQRGQRMEPNLRSPRKIEL